MSFLDESFTAHLFLNTLHNQRYYKHKRKFIKTRPLSYESHHAKILRVQTMVRSAGTGQLVTPTSHVGGFSFFVFLNPWASILKDIRVWCIAPDFLFKSVLAYCEAQNGQRTAGCGGSPRFLRNELYIRMCINVMTIVKFHCAQFEINYASI